MVNLIRIYRDTVVKSKKWNFRLYRDLHQNFQVQTLKNYSDFCKYLQGLGKLLIIGKYASPLSL